MSDLLQAGGTGGLGAVIGAVSTFFGFKSRINAIDERVDRMSKEVVYKDTCNSTVTGLRNEMKTQTILMTEMRKDIRDLLKKWK